MMFETMKSSVRHSVILALFAMLFVAPFGALAFSGEQGARVDQQGAGFVLYVTLQRNAMN